MLKIIELEKSFGSQLLFSDLSFNVNKGEHIGLVARNGHGKTTLFKMILGETIPDSGKIVIPKNYTIGSLSQHLKFTKSNILDEVCLGLHETEKDEEWKAKKILFGLGFNEDDLSKDPKIFSGGFQIRLNLARVLLSNPDMLLLDEPNNYLDIVAIRWLENFLKSYKNELILITHDRHFMDSVITHTLAIHRKKSKKIKGTTFKLYTQIEQEEEIHEKTRLNEQKKIKQTEDFIRRFRAKARLGGMVQSRIKSLEKLEKTEKLDMLEDLDFKFNYHSFKPEYLMSAEHISFSYDKKKPYLIDDFQVDIKKKDKIAIVGKNGKGKSTLLKLLAEVEKPVDGKIKKHTETRVGYFCQTNVNTLNNHNTIVEEIMSVDPSVTPQIARNVAGVLMFKGDDALKKISVLSGGEKNRVALAKILSQPCNLLLLDEPTNHLDLESCEALLGAIESFQGAVVLITHNEMYLESFARKLIVFDKGNINTYEKKYNEFLKDIGWEGEDQIVIKKQKKNRSDKKETKKLKAMLIGEKSKTLKPIKNKIEKFEKEIIALEDEKKLLEIEIIDAYKEQTGHKIQELSKKIHAISVMIDQKFKDLEETSLKHEQIEKEFNEKLTNL